MNLTRISRVRFEALVIARAGYANRYERNKDGMKSNWLKILAVAALALFAGGIALTDIYPNRPRSAIGWCILFALALPSWFFFEFIGERFTGSRFLARLGPAPRIALGVFALGGFVLLILLAFRFLEPFLTKWGS
jgi:hypothetical protein